MFPYMIYFSSHTCRLLCLRPQYIACTQHSQCLRGWGREHYRVFNIKRRKSTPTWCFFSIFCQLHYLLLCASMYMLRLYVHTHFGCQLVKTICGFMTPAAYLRADESVWIMQTQQTKNVSTGSEQCDTSQVGGNKLFKECHVQGGKRKGLLHWKQKVFTQWQLACR